MNRRQIYQTTTQPEDSTLSATSQTFEMNTSIPTLELNERVSSEDDIVLIESNEQRGPGQQSLECSEASQQNSQNTTEVESSNDSAQRGDELAVASMDAHSVVLEPTGLTQKPEKFECTDDQEKAMLGWFESRSQQKMITKKNRLELSVATGIPDNIISEYVKKMRRKVRYEK